MRCPALRLAVLLALAVGAAGAPAAQQIAIARVEAMPRLPSDYRLLDWDRLAAGFDSLAFDPARTGSYLPLVGVAAGGVNYPAYGQAGIETFVGSGNELPGEAITLLPALVSGSLVGADKRTQFGVDWVLRSQQFFNRRPAESVYLNGPTATSGSDGWYDTMPNVFFLQLRARYPGVGDSDAQLRLAAQQWRRAVAALGGSATPWRLPAIQYRAVALSTMTPRLDGVPEPEMAGAIAWILYHTFRETGDARDRIAAELAMDALVAQTQNPSYELQLPYGTLAAARMNAELGTSYDVEKLLRWSFERGPLRGWGTIAGITRGGRSLDGLVGEVDGDGYAFALNGFQQAAALVPVARYDDRFARAIGRWMVHLASASRLFYRRSLPDANQDSEDASRAVDPRGVIPYEALRGRWTGIEPFATGDALRNGWAPTNLALYAGASAGYLAAIVDSTEVRGVLRLDLRRTDVSRPPSYPSFLVYNPTAAEATITVPLPIGRYDVYDAASDAWLARGVSGRPAVTIPPDAARVLVFPTAGGTETLADGVLRVNGIAVDYRVGTPGNRPPRVRALVASDSTVARGETVTLHCTPGDAETAEPTVAWNTTAGTLTPNGRTATWSGASVGTADVTCTATDAGGRTGAASVTLTVVANQPPRGVVAAASAPVLDPGGQTALACTATDPDGDALAYAWTVTAGTLDGTGAAPTFRAPATPQTVRATCTATDPTGATATGTVEIVVGRLVLHLPLDGAGADVSGFGHTATLDGPTPAVGRTGAASTALAFDGLDDVGTVDATTALTPTAEVTVSLWVNPAALPERESFVVSHGSWQNRWKLSLTPTSRPRWTVRTSVGVVDLDAPAPVVAGRFTHLAATYDGTRLRLYVDGALAAERAHTGAMPSTALPLLLGQMLPGQADYNFGGVLDDVRLYNRALSPDEVQALYLGTTSAGASPNEAGDAVGRPYPNPASARVTLPLRLAGPATVRLTVVDALGRTVAVLHDGVLETGAQAIEWDAASVAAGLYVLRVERDGAARIVTRRVLVAR